MKVVVGDSDAVFSHRSPPHSEMVVEKGQGIRPNKRYRDDPLVFRVTEQIPHCGPDRAWSCDDSHIQIRICVAMSTW